MQSWMRASLSCAQRLEAVMANLTPKQRKLFARLAKIDLMLSNVRPFCKWRWHFQGTRGRVPSQDEEKMYFDIIGALTRERRLLAGKVQCPS